MKPPQSPHKKYIIKVSWDGAALTKNLTAVQGTMKLIEVDEHGKPVKESSLPKAFDKEICLYYYIGQETYENQRRYAEHVFRELEEISRDGIFIQGVKYQIEIVCCSDWKASACVEENKWYINVLNWFELCNFHLFLQILLLQKEESNVGQWPIQRCSAARQQCLAQTDNQGYIREPLLHIEPECSPPDLLHLRKGVISKCLSVVVDWVLAQNNEKMFIEEMNRLHVPFKFYTEKGDTLRKTHWKVPHIYHLQRIFKKLDLSTVLREELDERYKPIEKLTVKQLKQECLQRNLSDTGLKEDLVDRLKTEIGEHTQLMDTSRDYGNPEDNITLLDIDSLKKVWKDCQGLFDELKGTPQNIDDLERRLYQWGLDFKAYTFDNEVTPYMHVFVYHTPFFLRKYGTLGVFEMDAVEQMNYIFKLAFFGRTNRGRRNFSIAEQIMRYATRCLVGWVQNLERVPRKYVRRQVNNS